MQRYVSWSAPNAACVSACSCHALHPQFCHKYTLQRLAKLPEVAGCEAKLRMTGDKPYVTDNSNFIVDLYFQARAAALLRAFAGDHVHCRPGAEQLGASVCLQTPIKDSHAASRAILALEGVVEHGLFLDMVDVCIIAGATGVTVQSRKK
jgi:ribose 5-phosphate isomerase A